MSQRTTTVAERNRIVDLKLSGYTLREIAEHTGWSFECVRKWWRRYRDCGRSALCNRKPKVTKGGAMSTFPGIVRYAFLRIKKMHPGWGAAVARPRVAERLGLAETEMPCISTIEKCWAKYADRLYARYHKRHAKAKQERGEKPTEAHQRWQADFKEWITIKGLGKVDVLNIRDEATPVKIGSFVFPARKATGRDVQEAFRQAFSQWGLCDRVQTDKDKRLVKANHPHPFPTPFILWLVGLGIAHDIAPSAPENGCSERFNRTWNERVALGRTATSLEELQLISDDELFWMNHKLPSRGRNCAGQPPLIAYPQALQPRRPYSPETELDLFSMQRIYEFLTTQFWWRRVSNTGQISLGGHRYGIGSDYKHQDVKITFNAEKLCFYVEDDQGTLIKSFRPTNLTIAHITRLELNDP